jgi:TPP-dependent pyruvate/acetoin dehydrogenase alpha subunit
MRYIGIRHERYDFAGNARRAYAGAQMKSAISVAARTALYRTMVRIRAFENAAEAASQGGVSAYGQQAAGGAKVRGPLHLSTGQEAVPAGVCAHLTVADYLTSTHRGHGHTLAKGANLGRMMDELFGKATGSNGGKGGSMHIADFSIGMDHRLLFRLRCDQSRPLSRSAQLGPCL